MANKQITIKPENWVWCTVCDRVSYDYECECGSSACNCTGCEKCAEIQKVVEKLLREGKYPSEDECKENNLLKFGSVDIPETKLMKEIFGEE